jgi:hypothetical protein
MEGPVDDETLNAAIATYRAELAAEATLRADDLDEVEEHLRALVADLRTAGAAPDVAFAEAVRRLGDPRAIAREYAHVRPTFGATLSRPRAWSAVVLLAAMLIFDIVIRDLEVLSLFWPVLMATMVGLAARRTWARALALGWALFVISDSLFWVWSFHGVVVPTWYPPPLAEAVQLKHMAPRFFLMASVGMAAFLIPWRRGEMSQAGWALALLAVAYVGVDNAYGMSPTPAEIGDLFHAGVLALCCFAVGGLGLVLRARWGSAVLCLGAAAVLPSVVQRSFEQGGWYISLMHHDATSLVAIVAMLAAARLSWRTARPGRGTLRGLAA